MSKVKELLRHPQLPRVLSIRLTGLDPEGNERVYRLTNAVSLVTEPEDAPSAVPHLSLLAGDSGLACVHQMGARGSLGGLSLASSARIRLLDLEQRLDWDRDQIDLEGQVAEVLLGGIIHPDGSPFRFGEFEPVLCGHIDSATTAEVRLSGDQSLIADGALLRSFGRWGGGLRFESGQIPIAPEHPNFDVSGDLTLTATCRVRDLSGTAILARRQVSGSPPTYALRLEAGGVLAFRQGTAVYRSPAGSVSLDRITRLAAVVSQLQLTLYVDADVVYQAQLSTPVESTAGFLLSGGSSSFDLDIYELGLRDVALTADELAADGPALDATGYRWLYKFEDRPAAEAREEAGGSALPLVTNQTWSPSLDGDDIQRPGGVSGKVPRILGGPVYNAPLRLVDTPGLWYRASDRPLGSVDQLRHHGVPLHAPFSLASGSIAIDAGAQTLIGPSGSFAGLVPRQDNPLRPGQTVQLVTASGLNDGVYEVASVDAGGAVLEVVEALTASEAAGQQVTISAAAPEYSVDLDEGVLSTVGGLGIPTEGLRLDAAATGEASTSALLTLITGREIETSEMQWDPNQGLYLEDDPDERTIQTLLDGAFAAAWDLPDGRLKVATITDPVEEPLARLQGIIDVRPEVTVPAWSFEIGYARNYSPISSVAPSVLPSEAEHLGAPFSWVSHTLPTVRKRFRNATTIKRETLLTSRADAQALLERNQDFWGLRRRWFRVVLDAGGLGIQLNQDFWLDFPKHGLSGGVPVKVVYLKQDPLRSKVEMQVITRGKGVR